MDALVWQHLLAADLSWNRSREVAEALEAVSLDPLSVLRSPGLLSERERAAMARCDLKALQRALASGARVVEPSAYPRPLRPLEHVPAALFARGDVAALERPTVGVVGTRRASPYARGVASSWAKAFAQAGVTTVSGGALGVDEATHEGSLAAGGQTVAVFGCGIDISFPAGHADLYRRISEQGCCVSQFAAGAPSMSYNFPARNALIAALSDVVVVVEAPKRSGSLITAGSAAEFGRPVVVVPGPIDRGRFEGSHGLIRDGATLVDHPDQVLEMLEVTPSQAAVPIELSENQALVLAATDVESRSIDEISDACGLDPAQVAGELTLLEIEGLVIRTTAGYAIRP